MDSQGRLWWALFSAGKVLCLNADTGEVLRTIEFDFQYSTSVAFGGPDYKTMLVTSAKRMVPDNPGKNGGVALITFTDGTQGVAPSLVKIPYGV